jgi:hypothetical protein
MKQIPGLRNGVELEAATQARNAERDLNTSAEAKRICARRNGVRVRDRSVCTWNTGTAGQDWTAVAIAFKASGSGPVHSTSSFMFSSP